VSGWRQRAACRGADPELFFPGQGDRYAAEDAKDVCLSCPVQADCLEAALVAPLPDGIWAGLNLHERKALRAGRRRQVAAEVA
jgi:WhiB family redox-sensing transcriptional regulator